MDLKTITKDPARAGQYNLGDYDAAYRNFDWQQARDLIRGLDGGLNIAYEAVDRHVEEGFGDKVALRWLGKQGEQRDFSYAELQAQTARFANVLQRLGVQPGETVFGLCGRVPQLYIALLGTLKFAAVFSPLFSAFGPEPVRARMEIGKARLMVTSEALYLKKVAPWRDQLPSLRDVLLYDVKGELPPGCHDLDKLLQQVDDRFAPVPCDAEQLALLHFTSGTTGKPKGAMHVHGAVIYHKITGRFALDLHRPLRAGSAPRRHLLVYRGSRLGDGDLLRHPLATVQPADAYRR